MHDEADNLMLRAFTVDDVDRMVEAGVLHEDDRVELLDGRLVQMPPPGPNHASIVKKLNAHFGGLQPSIIVSVQDPLRLDETNQPLPDVALLRFREDYYASAHPTGTDALLVVEVADSSRGKDIGIKAALYASHGVPEYWVVDLANTCLMVHREPTSSGYDERKTHRPGDSVAPQVFTEHAIDLATLFGV